MLASLVLTADQTAGVSSEAAAFIELEAVMKTLRKKDGVMLDLKKKTKNTIMDRTYESEGHLYYWNGKVRVEIHKPEASTMILDGKNLWLVSEGDEFSPQVRVTKSKLVNLKKSSALWAVLLEKKNLQKEFAYSSSDLKGEVKELTLQAKNPAATSIHKLKFWYNRESSKLTKVMYWDDRDNEVEFNLGSPQKVKGDRKKLFSYQPPKGAEVTEI